MVKMYHHTKNKVSRSMLLKGIACSDKQTDRQTNTQTYRYTDTETDNIKHNLTSSAGGKNSLYFGILTEHSPEGFK